MPKLVPKKKKSRGSVYEAILHAEDKTKKFAYINITILDASEAIYGMVHAKVSETHKNWIGPQKFKDKVAHKAAKLAAGVVPKEDIAKKLMGKIPKMLMYKMHHKMGMRLAAQPVFRERSYAVIQIQVQHVDSKRMLATAKEEMKKSQNSTTSAAEEDDDDSVATAVLDEWIEEQKLLHQEEQESPFVTTSQLPEDDQDDLVDDDAENCLDLIKAKRFKEAIVVILAWIMHQLMPVTITRDLEANKLPALIQKQITKEMQTMLDKKLESKNMKAETAVLGEEDQARYFFANIQKIRSKSPAEGEGDLEEEEKE